MLYNAAFKKPIKRLKNFNKKKISIDQKPIRKNSLNAHIDL